MVWWHSYRRLAGVLLAGAAIAGACSSNQPEAPAGIAAPSNAPLQARFLDTPACDEVERYFTAEEDDTFWYGVAVEREEVERRFRVEAALESEIASGPLAGEVADIERWYDLHGPTSPGRAPLRHLMAPK